jgi:hypothetical protein
MNNYKKIIYDEHNDDCKIIWNEINKQKQYKYIM